MKLAAVYSKLFTAGRINYLLCCIPCCMTLLFTCDMIALQLASMVLNADPSFGICFMISSAPKIGSRYSHLP